MLKKMSAKRLVAVVLSLICLCSIGAVAFAATPPSDADLAVMPLTADGYRLNTSASPVNRSNVNIWAVTGNPSQRWKYTYDKTFDAMILVVVEKPSLALNLNHSNNNCEMLNPRNNNREDCAIHFADESSQGGSECYGIIMKYQNMALEIISGLPHNGLNVCWATPGQYGQQDRQLWHVWAIGTEVR